MSANAAHFDDNQVPTIMGVAGNLGTSDTAGTAKTLPFSLDPETGAAYIADVPGTSYGTQGTAGAETWGTMVSASGAGTYQRVKGLSIVVESGTVDCAITFGTMAGPNGNDVLARGKFAAGGGIARDYTEQQISPANGTITYWLGGAGTAYFTVNYRQST